MHQALDHDAGPSDLPPPATILNHISRHGASQLNGAIHSQRNCWSIGVSDRSSLRSRAEAVAVPLALLVLSTCCRPPRPVTQIRQAALADRLALRRVGDRMIVVTLSNLIRPLPSSLNRRLRRLTRDQAVAPVPDEVAPPGLEQRLPHHEVVLGLEELHQGSLHLPVPQSLARHKLLHP